MKLSPLLILSAVHAHEIKDFMGSRAFALSVIKNIKYIVQALHLIFFPPDTAHCFMHIIKHTPKYSKQFIEQIPSFPVRVIVHNVSFRSIRRCFTAYSHYMCCWQILQHTKKRRTPHFTYGARHFVYRSYTPLILQMLNFINARCLRCTVQWFCQMRRNLPGSCLRAFFSPMPYGLRNLQRCALLLQHIPRNPVMS